MRLSFLVIIFLCPLPSLRVCRITRACQRIVTSLRYDLAFLIPRTLLRISSLADSCCLYTSLGSFADDGLCRRYFPNLLIGTGWASEKNSGGIALGPKLICRPSWILFISSFCASNSATLQFTATSSAAFSCASFICVRLLSKVEIARSS